MKILVTGGAGYLGSILVPELLKRGHEVHVLDTFHGSGTSLLDCIESDRFHVTKGDCRDAQILSPVVAWSDLVIPLAGLVGAPACEKDQEFAKSVNLHAIRLLLSIRTTQPILFPATDSGYGAGPGGGGVCTEESPISPQSLYGHTKAEAEKAVLDSGNCVSFRLASLFGASPRMRFDLLLHDFTRRAYRERKMVLYEGSAVRNFIHIRDVAGAFILGLERFPDMRDRPFNVALTAESLPKAEICRLIGEFLPDFEWTEAPIASDPDRRDYQVSNAKLMALGWRPRYSIRDGIIEILKVCRMYV
jgi:nucleoside-diphosphate-sugar epimerase